MSNENGLAEIDGDDESGLAELPDENSGNVRLPKVAFFGSATKSPRLETLKAAGVEVNAFYLQDEAGVIAPKPFSLFVTPARLSVYGKFDEDGKRVVAVRKKEEGGWRPDFKRAEDKGWSDLTVALVLVPLGTAGITPAILRTFKGIDNIWKPVGTAAKMAKDPAVWAVRGEPYKVASAAVAGFGRFVLHPSVRDEPMKSNPNRKFAQGDAKVQPTPAALVPVFNEFVQSDAYKQALDIFTKIKAKLLELPQTA